MYNKCVRHSYFMTWKKPTFLQVCDSRSLQTDVKKNTRLSAVLAGGSASGPRADGMDDPFAAPTHVATCPHCGITQNGLGRNGQMDKHYARECKMMNTCKYCLRVVLVSRYDSSLFFFFIHLF